MAAAKLLVYASSEVDLTGAMLRLHTSCKKYPQFVKYIEEFFHRRKEWALCLRDDIPNRGNNTNNLVESAFRVLKDTILHR